MKKIYRVYFNPYSTTDYAKFQCDNKTQAREDAELYRRQWDVKERIVRIVEETEENKEKLDKGIFE